MLQGSSGPRDLLASAGQGPPGPWDLLASASQGPPGPRDLLASAGQGPPGPRDLLLTSWTLSSGGIFFIPVSFIFTQYLFTLSLEVITVSNVIILIRIKSCLLFEYFISEQEFFEVSIYYTVIIALLTN